MFVTTKTLSREVVEARLAARSETGVVRAYLEGLNAQKDLYQGRYSLEDRLDKVEKRLKNSSDVIEEMLSMQKRKEILDLINKQPAIVALESEFVKVAKSFSDRRGISPPVWKEMGVPTDVLKRSGILSA